MIIYACDRCGKKISVDYAPRLKAIGIVTNYISKGEKTPKNDRQIGLRRDLCDECQRELEEWWNKGAANN